MNYNVTEVHNSGLGEDVSWCNIKIHDLTKEQLDAVLAFIQPWYAKQLEEELADHLKYMKEHQPMARTG
jgi:hypothetical protein